MEDGNKVEWEFQLTPVGQEADIEIEEIEYEDYNPDVEQDRKDTEEDKDPNIDLSEHDPSRPKQKTQRKQQSIEDVANLIGDKNADEVLGFREGFVREKGRTGYGAVFNGMIKIAETEGMVVENIGRHEGIHFIINYMMSANRRNKLYAEAQAKLDKMGSTQEAKEYIAELFEDGNYETPKGFLQKVLLEIKKLLYRIKLYSGDILTIMSLADEGYFQNRKVLTEASQIDTTIAFKERGDDIEEITPGHWNTDEFTNDIFEIKTTWFGSASIVDQYSLRVITPMIMQNSEISKAVNLNPKRARGTNNTFSDAAEIAWQKIVAEDKRHRKFRDITNEGKIATTKRPMKYHDGNDWVNVEYGKITKPHFLQAVKGARKVTIDKNGKASTTLLSSNEEFINAYFVQQFTGPYLSDNLDDKDRVEFHEPTIVLREGTDEEKVFTRKQIFHKIAQISFDNVDLSRTTHKGQRDIITVVEMDIMEDRDEVSPTRNTSSFVKVLFKTTQLRNYRKTKDGDILDSYFDTPHYMDFGTMDDILREAVEEIHSKGIRIGRNKLSYDVNMKTIMLSLKALLKKTAPGINRAHYIHTFLVEYGNEVAQSVKDNAINKKLPSTDSLTGLVNLNGIGYYLLATSPMAQMDKYFPNAGGTLKDQIARKKRAFRKVMFLIEDAYNDVHNSRGGNMTILNTQFGTRTSLKQYNSKNRTLVRSEVRKSINNGFYAGTGGFISANGMSAMRPGEDQQFKVTTKELWVRDNSYKKPVFVKILTRNDDGTYTKHEDAQVFRARVQQALKFLLNNHKINHNVVEALETGSGVDGQKSMLERGLFGLFLKLQSGVLHTESFQNNGTVDEDGKNYVIPETLEMTEVDDMLEKGGFPPMDKKEREEGNVNLHNMNDMHEFLNDHVSFHVSLQLENGRDKTVILKNGNMKQALQSASVMAKDFSSDDVYDKGSTEQLVLRNKEEAQNLAIQADKKKPGSAHESANVTIKRGEDPVFRNPIMNERLKASPTGSMDSMENARTILMSKDMSKYDYIKALFYLTRDEITSSQGKVWR